MASHLKRWVVQPRITPEADINLKDFPPVLRQILFNRGFSEHATALSFLSATPPAGADPFALLGMESAIKRLETALINKETVIVYGDYDADGVTATALLVKSLEAMGIKSSGYIPNRFDEGYGLNNEALASLYHEGIRLVISVDCGIRSLQEAKFATGLGLDLIITDHHHPGSELPEALAVINPKRAGDPYPYKELAGVGVAYKLAQALYTWLQQKGIPVTKQADPDNLLDLVAIGTVADLAPLTTENRYFVRKGLNNIQSLTRQGLASLMNIAGLNPSKVNTGNIGFTIGPRLNAAGRLESALAAYELLTTEDFMEAGRLAQQLEVQNQERQELTKKIQVEAEGLALAAEPTSFLLFASDVGFNPGVVGLAASRLMEQHYRPAIVAHQGEEFTRASCRSIKEFHITEALDQCSDLLERYGGHAAAAGFTVRNERLPELLNRLKDLAGTQLTGLDLRPTLVADLEIPLVDLTAEVLNYIDLVQPCGYGNNNVVFVARNVKLRDARAIGRDSSHLKMRVTDGWVTFDAIAFRMGHLLPSLSRELDLMFTFETNEWNGQQTLQLNIKDLKPAGLAD